MGFYWALSRSRDAALSRLPADGIPGGGRLVQGKVISKQRSRAGVGGEAAFTVLLSWCHLLKLP